MARAIPSSLALAPDGRLELGNQRQDAYNQAAGPLRDINGRVVQLYRPNL